MERYGGRSSLTAPPSASWASSINRRHGVSLPFFVATLDDPRSIGEALKGSKLGEFWKYRIGDYRVIARIEDAALRVLVVRVGSRDKVYR